MQKFGEHIKENNYFLFNIYFNLFFLYILGSNSEAQAFLQRDGQVIIRMRGLPFDATAKDVVSIYNACKAIICLSGVVYKILFKMDGSLLCLNFLTN
jgi:hypothetical protein